MAGEHILGWPIAVVRDRRVVAETARSTLRQTAAVRATAPVGSRARPRSTASDFGLL